MEYLVMECHPGYVILLDEEGRFLRAANFHYEVGQKVTDPVLMRENPSKRPSIVRMISGGVIAAAACLLILLGVRYYDNHIRPYSSIYLSINPEVQMELNKKGTVVGLEGLNEDGEQLLLGYSGKGKDKVTVADELIDRAIEMGFLSEGGQVSFSIDAPDEALFMEYGMELRTQVEEHLDGRISVTIRVISHGTETEASDSVKPTAAPETAPSTEAPTAPETAPSMEAPTVPETAPSTEAPTMPETAPETAAPTEPPTAPETAAPTEPPTAPETAAPTRPPAPTSPPASGGDSDYHDGDTDYGPENDDDHDDGDSGYDNEDDDD